MQLTALKELINLFSLALWNSGNRQFKKNYKGLKAFQKR